MADYRTGLNVIVLSTKERAEAAMQRVQPAAQGMQGAADGPVTIRSYDVHVEA